MVFEGPEDLPEAEFEAALWKRVQSLSDKDVWRGQDYDPAVSPDPENPHFSLSFGGEAFSSSACIPMPAARRGASGGRR